MDHQIRPYLNFPIPLISGGPKHATCPRNPSFPNANCIQTKTSSFSLAIGYSQLIHRKIIVRTSLFPLHFSFFTLNSSYLWILFLKSANPNIMVNKVILIGNLGRDPEVKYLEGNVAVAKFSVATNESYRDKKTGEWQTLTEWHDVVAWRALAERAEKQLKKGSQVFVEGKLTHRKYQDKDGNDRYVTEVVAQSFRILDRKDSRPGGQDDDFHPEDHAQDPQVSGAPRGEQQADDDLPF